MNDVVTQTTVPAEAPVVETPIKVSEDGSVELVQNADHVGEEVLAQDASHTA